MRKKKSDGQFDKMKNKEIDTLIIVGNGFDIWRGLNTSYSSFRNYYLEHRIEIIKCLKLKPYKFNGIKYI